MKFVISDTSFEERKRLGNEFSEEQMKNIEVLPLKEIEKINEKNIFLMCPDSPDTPDCVKGKCSDCGKTSYYQPDNEKIKRKLCEDCWQKIIAGEIGRE